MKAIKITTEKQISIIDIPENYQRNLLKFMQNAVGGYIEPVNLKQFIDHDFLYDKIMIVDEGGILKRKKPNRIATDLYGNYSTIVGDVIIMKIVKVNNETDITGLTDFEAKQLYAYLCVIYKEIMEVKK